MLISADYFLYFAINLIHFVNLCKFLASFGLIYLIVPQCRISVAPTAHQGVIFREYDRVLFSTCSLDDPPCEGYPGGGFLNIVMLVLRKLFH